MATLFVVSTPIGNLGDITQRALEVLRQVRRVLAEDTRRTRVLFQRYEIRTPLYSAHAHNEQARLQQVLGWLTAEEDVALVSDAGTPLLSDPGSRLVGGVIAAGHTVTPIPGASALLAALVASGLDLESFVFYGFPPRAGTARTRRLQEAASSPHTCVFYEAPGRVSKLLADLEALCGGERRVVVARELTKLHEEFVRGTLAEAAAYYREGQVRGEVVVMLAGAPAAGAGDASQAVQLLRSLLDEGEKPSVAARTVARQLGIPRSEAYRLALAAHESAEEQG